MTVNASSAALTLAGSAMAGIVSQSVARSVNVPGIVLLLLVGVLLGPDVANIIQPQALGSALPEVVGFAVAVILFEGGMHLKLSRFGKQSKSIRRLVTYGALITAIGATLACKLVMGWDWRHAGLFGSLVIVTGPTVVTPLVRRFKLVPAVGDVLEAEGVLIDALGAVLAVVALEVALEPSTENLAKAGVGIAVRLGLGALLGLVAGFALAWLLRARNLIAEGLENVFTLAMVWGLFKASEALVHESGIAAVTIAGLVLGNVRSKRHERLLDFNDQLTVLLIGMLFVLLAADVRLADVLALGWPGLLTVAALVLAVRPINVFLSTMGAGLAVKQRAFIAWIGPRGIIAAAVASLFASTLASRNIEGGEAIKALVFLVIAVTVVLAGLTGGPLAKALGLSQQPKGWLFLGANALAVSIAEVLVGRGQDVMMLDRSVDHCTRASKLGISVVQGNGLDDEMLQKLRIDQRAAVAAVTPSDEINLLFIQKARDVGKVKTLYAALKSATLGASAKDVQQAGGWVLFADEYEVDRWMALLRDDEAEVRRVTAGSATTLPHGGHGNRLAIPLVLERGSTVRPVASDIEVKNGDHVYYAVDMRHEEEAMTWLHLQGWQSE